MSDVATQSKHQSRTTLKVGGRSYAVAMTWVLAQQSENLRRYARQECGDTGNNLWAHHEGQQPQLALGTTAKGHKAGMPVLAVEVAGRLHGDWAGVFEVDGAFYVLSTQRGAVDKNSDLAFSDSAEAIEVLRELVAYHSVKLWGTEGVPALAPDLGIEVTDVLSKLGKPTVRLQRSSAAGGLAPFVRPALYGALAVMGAVYLFPDQWLAFKRQVGLEPPPKKQVVTIPPMPWAGQPKADQLLASCVSALRAVPRDAAGWHGTKATCDGRNLTLTVTRSGSVADRAPPITWLDRWKDDQPALRDLDGVALGKPRYGVVAPSTADILWSMPAPKERWRDADRDDRANLTEVQSQTWRAAEGLYLKSSFQPGASLEFAKTAQGKVEADMSAILQIRPALKRKLAVLRSLVYDLDHGVVVADFRLHSSSPFPTGPDVEIERTPDPSTLDSGPLPPAEP